MPYEATSVATNKESVKGFIPVLKAIERLKWRDALNDKFLSVAFRAALQWVSNKPLLGRFQAHAVVCGGKLVH